MGIAIVILIVVGLAVAGALIYALRGRGSAAPAAEAGPDITRTQAPVAEFHVRGDEAQVFFDVPLPEGEPDEVLRALLVHEAVEVVREKRHTLPIADATKVVAYGRSGDDYARVGEVVLETPGTLPPPVPPPVALSHATPDPLGGAFVAAPTSVPGTVDKRREETLRPVGSEVSMPAQLEAAVRAQGVDPQSAAAGDLVVGILRATGYGVTPAGAGQIATKGGSRTYVEVDRLEPGGYPELEESAINAFMVAFASSGADRGLLVSDKYGPFLVYEKEKREPRIRFVTRERLQSLIDSLAVS